ncbi:MAG: hypothetical protein K6G38_03345 [Gammaproteobacteria bacterium]|nr:hypothetical protein [Gammaproteobacteria bacterium]
MKKLLSVFAALALVLSLVGCVNGAGSKGYKSAKEQIQASLEDGSKVKFNGGNFIYLKAQTITLGNVLGNSVNKEIENDTWYFEIKATVTDAEGEARDKTYYFYYAKGDSKATFDLAGSVGYTLNKSYIENGAKGKLGTL